MEQLEMEQLALVGLVGLPRTNQILLHNIRIINGSPCEEKGGFASVRNTPGLPSER